MPILVLLGQIRLILGVESWRSHALLHLHLHHIQLLLSFQMILHLIFDWILHNLALEHHSLLDLSCLMSSRNLLLHRLRNQRSWYLWTKKSWLFVKSLLNGRKARLNLLLQTKLCLGRVNSKKDGVLISKFTCYFLNRIFR